MYELQTLPQPFAVTFATVVIGRSILFLPLTYHFSTNNQSGLCDKMASATLKELTKAPTLSPPVDSDALPEHLRNIRYKASFPETVLNAGQSWTPKINKIKRRKTRLPIYTISIITTSYLPLVDRGIRR